ncbi:hypothetical protein GCM10027020_08880 [Nocardioides salsibiostraticola]
MDPRTPRNIYRIQLAADASPEARATRFQRLVEFGVDWLHLPAYSAVHPGGGRYAGLEALSESARAAGLGLLVDIEPAHVDVSRAEPGDWWWDVLTHGRASAHAAVFDIDWETGEGQVLLPWLEEGDAVPSVERDGVRYLDRDLPLAPGTSRLKDQHYRLVPAHSSDHPVNYRRSHADSSLAAVRVEDREIFDLTHREVERWFEQDLVDGLCVRHVDALADPTNYLYQLAEVTRGAFVLVEKSLVPGEALPPSWAAAGTISAAPLIMPDLQLKRDQVATRLDPEIRWIVRELPSAPPVAAPSTDKQGRGLVSRMRQRFAGPSVTPLGHPAEVVEDAVTELVACFPVARSYLPIGRNNFVSAFSLAAQRRPDLAVTLDALEEALRDPEQPSARRFELATGAAVDGWRTPLAAATGPVDDLLSLTRADLPSAEDLEPGAEELRNDVRAAGLRLRRDRPDLFTSYTLVEVRGEASASLLAFDRGGAIAVVTRDAAGLAAHDGWGSTEMALPAGDWWDHVTGRDLGSDGWVFVDELLDLAPVALLTRDER